jgi:hypothetical protein
LVACNGTAGTKFTRPCLLSMRGSTLETTTPDFDLQVLIS